MKTTSTQFFIIGLLCRVLYNQNQIFLMGLAAYTLIAIACAAAVFEITESRNDNNELNKTED